MLRDADSAALADIFFDETLSTAIVAAAAAPTLVSAATAGGQPPTGAAHSSIVGALLWPRAADEHRRKQWLERLLAAGIVEPRGVAEAPKSPKRQHVPGASQQPPSSFTLSTLQLTDTPSVLEATTSSSSSSAIPRWRSTVRRDSIATEIETTKMDIADRKSKRYFARKNALSVFVALVPLVTAARLEAAAHGGDGAAATREPSISQPPTSSLESSAEESPIVGGGVRRRRGGDHDGAPHRPAVRFSDRQLQKLLKAD